MTDSTERLAFAIDLQTVRIVHAVAEHGSLTAAATALGYSQPAVSQQLRRFEDRTGVALVERAGRGIRLTEAGRALARHARAVTDSLEAAAGELADLRGLRSGRVRLVAFPSASPTLVPRLIARLATSHPGIEVTFVEAEPPEAVQAVRENRADLAITFSYPGDRDDPHRQSARGLDVRPYGSERMRLVLPAADPLAGLDEVPLERLADRAWIAGCPRCRGHLLELAHAAGFTPRIAFETDNFVAVEGMVAQGLGVALLPELALQAMPRHPGVAVRGAARDDVRSLHVVTARGGDRVPAIAAALAALAALADDDASEASVATIATIGDDV
ncbi:LysR family transcriptional regulator [Agromyces aerolatus]|uniref:LysR family transcriptional regulator n=1 Tax=Agromyces sp. LY-1074 TaxID=3074080 RepID=UPI002854B3E9|nr:MULTISPECIES: LysR family transcriptional regulator [unclassified Agromyces]MDR5699087.1 LysR family transcriptional regulator [Agromyces sp. LY-1074]MDR5705135.1 LysR family transcriptional regulator [Agromyces sp. LY-1358]